MIDFSFETWMRHVFDHPAVTPEWYIGLDAERWNGEPAVTVPHLIHLFESPARLLKEYTPLQLEQGLQYLAGNGGAFTHDLLDRDVAWPLRRRGLQAMQVLFEKFFAVACADVLGHQCKSGTTPINGVCYMWWDIFPWWGDPSDNSHSLEDKTILAILTSILGIPSEACRESALHGLGHWHPNYPERVQQIIDNFLASDAVISAPLREYARNAQVGNVL